MAAIDVLIENTALDRVMCVCVCVCSRKRRQSGIFCGFTPGNRAYTSNRAYARFVLLAR